MRANHLTGSPNKSVTYKSVTRKIVALPKKRLVLQHLRALAVIPGKENGKSQGRRERGMN